MENITVGRKKRINKKESWEKVNGNKRNSKKLNILLAIICILLIGVLGSIFMMSRESEKAEAHRLEKLAGSEQKGIEDYEAVKEHASQLEKEDGAADDSSKSSDSVDAKSDADSAESSDKADDKKANAATDSDTTESADSTDSTDETAADTADTKKEISGIVCWGDDLINGEESNTYSYMAVLQKLLTENGYSNLTVINKTLQGGGTLSMMKMAGVSDDTIQGYITKHQQAANGAQLNVTETGIRDLTEEETTRNDLDCIPVIFMGYYGGWNHDPAELAEQQENILNTFQDKEEFLVVGTRPMDGTVTSDALDQVLSQKWGEHYISLASVTPQPASTKEAQQAMPAAILQKLQELNYISKKKDTGEENFLWISME